MVLITAISNPSRLDRYLPEGVVEKVYLEDHAYFDEQSLKTILEENNAVSILCTSKDRVKMVGFKLPISEMKLKLEIQDEVFMKIEDYREGYCSEK
jgi:tetraacyldisaccharide 4'-kinase